MAESFWSKLLGKKEGSWSGTIAKNMSMNMLKNRKIIEQLLGTDLADITRKKALALELKKRKATK